MFEDQFDLQLFAAESDASDDTVAQEDAPPIPEELRGISEEVARDVMKQHADANPSEGSAEPASENNVEYQDAKSLEDVKVPYSQLKQQTDKNSELEKLVAAYRSKYGDLEVDQSAPQSPTEQPKDTPTYQMPQFKPQSLSPDAAKQIEQAINEGALQLSGLSQEDVDSMDYMEDDDPRRAQYQYARKMAESAVLNHIAATQVQNFQQQQAVLAQQHQAVAKFNDYVEKQKQTADFANVQAFAVGDYFNQQSPFDRQVIADAYNRIERNVASPTDMMLIENYFEKAKAVYGRRNPAPTVQPRTMQQKPAAGHFPRSSKVNGVSGAGGGITAASLTEMFKTLPWNEIPQEYKDVMLGVKQL